MYVALLAAVTAEIGFIARYWTWEFCLCALASYALVRPVESLRGCCCGRNIIAGLDTFCPAISAPCKRVFGSIQVSQDSELALAAMPDLGELCLSTLAALLSFQKFVPDADLAFFWFYAYGPGISTLRPAGHAGFPSP